MEIAKLCKSHIIFCSHYHLWKEKFLQGLHVIHVTLECKAIKFIINYVLLIQMRKIDQFWGQF